MPDVPTDLARFRDWANRECGKWPLALQLKAWDAAHGKITVAEFIDALRSCED